MAHKILLVEDDPLIYRLYQRMLLLSGFEVELAENGQLALDKMAGFRPDIILLDIMMKTMNGMELLTKLKADPSTADIPVLVLTNMPELSVAEMATEKGALQVVVKSEKEPEDVVAIIKAVLDVDGAPQTTEAPAQQPEGQNNG